MEMVPKIIPVDPGSDHEIRLIANRMKYTLMEVLGDERGSSMYSDEWLKDRVMQHLDGRLDGEILLAKTDAKEICGHTILRVEDSQGTPSGLFSTIYVAEHYRRSGIGTKLLRAGESWFQKRKATSINTYTDLKNQKLIKLFEKHGYRIAFTNQEKHMCQLQKSINPE